MNPDLNSLISEVQSYVESINVGEDGEHLWTSYQEVVAISLRLQEIRNQLVIEEITSKEVDPQIKKFRTLLLDPTIDRLDKIASFESRKITARSLEYDMEKR